MFMINIVASERWSILFKKKDKSGGGGVPRLPCRYMSMYETMAAFDKAKSCHKCLIYDMQIINNSPREMQSIFTV